MATEQDVTSDSLDTTVVDVPAELLDYVKSSLVDYINKAKEFSAKIHHVEGQPPKMVVAFGKKSAGQPLGSTPHFTHEATGTNTILVRNIPDTADEELLEVFFESTKKQGGGPVKSVKILSKYIAFIEFCDSKSVETVMKKRPIKLGKTELEVEPYTPLLQGSEKINRVDVIGFAGEFTDDLLKKHFEYLQKNVSRAPVPDYGPELTALIKVGSRVVRGRDWQYCYRNEDGGGIGTVRTVDENFTVNVEWDNGRVNSYRIGADGCYDIKLAL